MIPAIDITIRISVLMGVALVAAAVLRGRSAAVRHWVLATALLSAAATPLIQKMVPAWQLGHAVTTPRQQEAGRPSAPAAGPGTPPVVDAHRGASGSVAGNAVPSRAAMDVGALLFLLWTMGALVISGSLVGGLARLRWLASRARPMTDGRWRERCDALARRCGLDRSVTLLQSDHAALLVTWGIARPRVILPAGAPTWSPATVDIVLAHELAHVQRGDWLVQLVGEIVRSMCWFNPLVWIVCSRLRRESERACDDAVLASGVEGPDYAQQLVDLARQMRGRRRAWLPAPAIVSTSRFEERIAAMLNKNVNRAPLGPRRRVATVVAMLTAAAAIASAQTSFGTLSGVVSDETGAVVPNVTIVLTHSASGTKHEMRSNAAGAYDFQGLTAGDYLFEASGPGFTVYREPLTFSPGQTVMRNVQLQLGKLQETITIVDGYQPPPAVNQVERKLPSRQCEPGTVGGNIRVPHKVADVRPIYPINLRPTKAEGVVNLEATIGTDGRVADVRVVSAPNVDLANAAVDAVRQWEFTPTLLNCKAVTAHMSVAALFKPAP